MNDALDYLARWCSGSGAGLVIGRSWVRFPAAASSGNDLGQVVHTNVPLFTKQYNLVRCEGFHVNEPYVAANGMGPVNKESKRFSSNLDRLEPLYKLLYFNRLLTLTVTITLPPTLVC